MVPKYGSAQGDHNTFDTRTKTRLFSFSLTKFIKQVRKKVNRPVKSTSNINNLYNSFGNFSANQAVCVPSTAATQRSPQLLMNILNNILQCLKERWKLMAAIACIHLQSNLSNTDTEGTEQSVRIRELSVV